MNFGLGGEVLFDYETGELNIYEGGVYYLNVHFRCYWPKYIRQDPPPPPTPLGCAATIRVNGLEVAWAGASIE